MVDVHSQGKMIQTDQISKLIIGGQTGVDAIQFWFKKILNGVDLSDPAYNWYIQFKNKNGDGESIPLQAVADDEYIKMIWTPGASATQVPGRLQIQIYATIVEGIGESATVTTRWVSEAAVIYVQENLSPDPINISDLSIFDYYLTMYQSFKDDSEAAAAAALASKNAAAISEGNAADSEAAALASKNAAAISEGNAADSEAAAMASKNAAAISEGNAADSEAAALASKNAAAISEGNAFTYKQDAAISETNAFTSEQAANSHAQGALSSKTAAEDAALVAIGAAGAANAYMIINGIPYVVSRQAMNGHIIKSITLYEEVV